MREVLELVQELVVVEEVEVEVVEELSRKTPPEVQNRR